MARRFISELKQDAQRGSATAALRLLDRSIRFRHKKLAVYRCLIAEQLGASLSDSQREYCEEVGKALTPAEISALLTQVQRFSEGRPTQSRP